VIRTKEAADKGTAEGKESFALVASILDYKFLQKT
jgi:hypothetical protein